MWIYDDNVDGDRQERTIDGVEIVKKITVDDIETGLDGTARTNYAIEYCGYSIGDEHPTYESDSGGKAYLRRMDAKALSPTQVEITLTFVESRSNMQISISSDSYQVDTNVDYQGNLLQVSYKYPDDYALDPTLQGVTISKSPTLTKEMSEVVMTITRQETTTASTIIQKAVIYKNSINLAGWSLWPNDPAGVWLFTDLNADSNGDGTYNMTYVFRGRAGIRYGEGIYKTGFGFDMFYRDERTGEPPADVVPYTSLVGGEPDTLPGGIKQAQLLYPYSDFNNIITV